MNNRNSTTSNFVLQLFATACVCVATVIAVSNAVAGSVDQTAAEAQRRTRVEMQLSDHEKQLEQLRKQTEYLVDAMRRVELKLGTSK
jgi:acetolactate synthase small subunit